MGRSEQHAARAVASILVVLWLTAAPAGAQEEGPTVPEAVTGQVVRSVGLVRSAGAIGSGWIADEDTVITNLHVARAGTGDIYIDYSDGERIECYTVAAHRDVDLAVLRCRTGDRPVLPIRPEIVPPDTPVATVGYPGGVGPKVTTGVMLPDRDVVRDIPTVKYTADTEPGSSGSPVVDDQGRVVAVVTFSGGHGVPIEELLPLLDEAEGLPVTKQGAENRLRLRRSIAAVVVVFPLVLFLRWRRGTDPLLGGAVRWAIGAAAVALALTQAQFMMIGPTLFL